MIEAQKGLRLIRRWVRKIYSDAFALAEIGVRHGLMDFRVLRFAVTAEPILERRGRAAGVNHRSPNHVTAVGGVLVHSHRQDIVAIGQYTGRDVERPRDIFAFAGRIRERGQTCKIVIVSRVHVVAIHFHSV